MTAYPKFLNMLSWIDLQSFLTINQHGFRKGKSTNTALLKFYYTFLEYIETGECPVGIFCDLSRAFDCVNHVKLLNVLYDYGIRGIPLQWISSFLCDRHQFVSLCSTAIVPPQILSPKRHK